MPLEAAVPPAPITGLPAPAGGLLYDISATNPERLVVELAGNATTGNGKGRYVNNTGETLRLRVVKLSAVTAPTGADLVVDVNVEGTSAFSVSANRPKIVAGAKAGSSVPARAGDPVEVAPGEVVTVDVDAVGSTVAGADVNITVEMVKIAPNNREGELY